MNNIPIRQDGTLKGRAREINLKGAVSTVLDGGVAEMTILGAGGSPNGTVAHISTSLVTSTPIYDDVGAEVTGGTTTLSIFRLRSDGTLDTFDFNDNTFKTGAVTTATASMTYRKGNNDTLNTGTWTHSLGTLTAFAAGDNCFAKISNASSYPTTIKLFFKYI